MTIVILEQCEYAHRLTATITLCTFICHRVKEHSMQTYLFSLTTVIYVNLTISVQLNRPHLITQFWLFKHI